MKTPDQFFHSSVSKEQPPETTLENHLTSLLRGPDGASGILHRIDTAPDTKSLKDIQRPYAIGLRDSHAMFLFGDGAALQKGLDFTDTVTARINKRFEELKKPDEVIDFVKIFGSIDIYTPFLRAAVRAQSIVPELAKEFAKPIQIMDLPTYTNRLKHFDNAFELMTARVIAVRVRAFLARNKLEHTLDEGPSAYIIESNDLQVPFASEFEDFDLGEISDPNSLTLLKEEFQWLKQESIIINQKRALLFAPITSYPKTIDPDTKPEKYAEYVSALAQFTNYTDRFFKFYLESQRLGLKW